VSKRFRLEVEGQCLGQPVAPQLLKVDQVLNLRACYFIVMGKRAAPIEWSLFLSSQAHLPQKHTMYFIKDLSFKHIQTSKLQRR
jgi:hypothetical protein